MLHRTVAPRIQVPAASRPPAPARARPWPGAGQRLARPGEPGPAQGRGAARAGVVREVLPGGMRLVIQRAPGQPVVAMHALWPGGMRAESPANHGITQLVAALITRGCGERDGPAVARAVQDLSGSMRGVAGRDSLGVRATWRAREWQQGLALLADCVLAPRFDSAEILKARRRLGAARQARAGMPAGVAWRSFLEALYPRHHYRRDPAGTADAVAAVGRSALSRFYRERFPIPALTLAVVGDVAPAQVLAEVRRRFGGRAGQAPPPYAAPETVFPDARAQERFHYLDRDDAHVVLGFPGVAVTDPDRAVLEVLAALLGGRAGAQPGGRLLRELGHVRGLAHHVEVVSVSGIEPGYLAIHIACAPERVDAVLRVTRAELARVAAEPAPAAELARARDALLRRHARAAARPASVAAALAYHEAHGLGVRAYQGYADAVRGVDAGEVQRAAARYIDWNAAVTVTVKPPDLSPGAARRARGVIRRLPRRALRGR